MKINQITEARQIGNVLPSGIWVAVFTWTSYEAGHVPQHVVGPFKSEAVAEEFAQKVQEDLDPNWDHFEEIHVTTLGAEDPDDFFEEAKEIISGGGYG